MDFTNELYEVIEDHARMLGINNLPIYAAFDDFISEQEHEIISSSTDQEKKQNISIDSTDLKNYPPNNKLGRLLTSLNFNNSDLISHHIEGFLNSFTRDLSTSQNILDIVKPSCTISDIQMPQRNRTILYAAKQKNIKTLSMEHGEGNGEQYKKLPIMYDYYIAYSPYNYNILKEMGVKDEQIFLTGFPETDLIYNYNIEEIKKELSNWHDINFNKKGDLLKTISSSLTTRVKITLVRGLSIWKGMISFWIT
ncbi:MAG: CDP-glycerol glycerophosphotransferase family protein [Candidatus Hodarchaeota archaeon]